MKILAIGDPHFKVDNTEETIHFSNLLSTYLEENQDIEYIVVLGDVLHDHEKLNTFALNNAVEFFKMLISHKRKVYCLVGNHDATSNTIFLSDNHWMKILKGWDGLTVVDKPIKVNLSSTDHGSDTYHGTEEEFIVLCPYVPPGRFVEALNYISDWNKSKIVFGHQEVDGVKMGMIVANGVEEWKEEYPMLILGHIHDKQKLNNNVYVVGSCLQHSYGEGSDKSLALINVPLKDVGFDDIEEIYLEIKKKKIIYADVSEFKEIQEKIRNENKNIEYKIVFSGNESDFKAIKNSTIYKDTLDMEKVKNITFKNKLKKDKKIVNDKGEEIEELKDKNIEELNNDFYECLTKLIIEENDPYLQSLYEHILYGKDDMSDKDVLFI